jgi:hypothetical protein
MKTTLAMALTLVALCVPRASTAQQMNFSYASFYYVSNDGSTCTPKSTAATTARGCTHVNYRATGYVYGPTGNATQTTAGLSAIVSVLYLLKSPFEFSRSAWVLYEMSTANIGGKPIRERRQHQSLQLVPAFRLGQSA